MIKESIKEVTLSFSEQMAEAVRACRAGETQLIELPAGVHHIVPDYLAEKYCNISNHDSGMKRMLFDLEGLENIIVEGNGAELIFHGRVIPFYLKDCKNITIRNLKIDWDRPFLSQAEIVAVGEGYLDLSFDTNFPVEVEAEHLVFTGDHFYSKKIDNLLEFDAQTRAPAAGARDNFGFRDGSRAESLGTGLVRLFSAYNPDNTFTVGNLVVIKHEQRWSPSIVLIDTDSTTLEAIDIYHSGGMGVIAQTCRDVHLRQVRVLCRPDSGRVFSVFVDAFHFVDCLGHVSIEDCVMEGQMDDAVNIHGAFLRPEPAPLTNTLRLRIMHHQQWGVQNLKTGDTAGFFCARTLNPLFEANIVKAEMLNCEIIEVTFDWLPDELDLEQLLVMRAEYDFNVLIKNCTMRDNRSRGVLFNAYGACRIIDSHFRTPWQAVRVSGAVDGKWHESGPSQYIEVSGCTFERCGYATGRPVIEVTAHSFPDGKSEPYHQKVIVRENQFELVHTNLLAVDNLGVLDFYSNEIQSEVSASLNVGPHVGLGRVEGVEVVSDD
ncbi:hypothetical protein QEH52_02580 [Coraliomargarita sp. SDUM461003]|uniref:Uncharacterized protein n=1 Tax=Thalassobacterium maritimum TaxID=3041265 RepID=A0ABU1AQD1_9BACT|nr:hypothetical protein [Coraliomargarita sp. SDUM461003]MDQ8206378.1 hypothetical protein [Coraliomargarita sp. SDUM461003]